MTSVRQHPVRSALTALAALLASGLAPLGVAPPAAAVSPDVVISQVYGGGGNTGATYTHDFIELFNRGTASVDLSTLSLQYASATGTGNFGANSGQLTELTGTLPPGSHFLVQEASTAAIGSPLPTADVVDDSPISMSGTSGKVALVTDTETLGCNGGSTPCSADQLSRIKDLVGYGTANFFEGAGAAPGLSNTTAALRAADGATDTDHNAADFAAGTPNPRACGSACEPPPPPPTGCELPANRQIAEVQGSGTATPLANQDVRVEGVVTGDFQAPNQLGGFFLQDPTPDADPATSDGLFAFGGTALTDVAVGDLVLVSGRAIEFNGLTELSPVTSVDVCGTDTIAPEPYDLPRPAGVTFEPKEGVLLTFPDTLTATEHFQLGRFGEITVAADGRLFQPTERVEPGPDAVAAADEAARRRLLVDDGSNVQNPPTVPFLTPEVVRIGDTTADVTGVLSFGFGLYRLQPTAPISFTRGNPRPAAPEDVGGDVRVASFNTLNYFTTLGQDNPNARGADTPEELARQQAKEVAAIVGLDADVLGLMEVENNGATAVGSLVDALNAATAPGTYGFVIEPAINPPNEFGGEFGTDAIKVAIIYRPAIVTPVGDAQTSADPIFDRPPLVQSFELAGGSEPFTVAVNHFKSKGCADATGLDLDQGDGQSCYNARRVAQATALAALLDDLALPNPLIIGDLNSYSREDPIDVLEAAGYVGLSEQFLADDDRYSFVFDGFSGELDHALAGADLLDNVTGAAIWHINADEPLILDYNTEFNPPGLYEPNAYRSSDHDPFLLGLDLLTAPGVPENVAALAGWHAVTVSWDEPGSGDAATGYVVRALRDGSLVDEVHLGADAREHTFGALLTGKTYTFEVVAENAEGSSGVGGPLSATPFRPARPARLDATPVCSSSGPAVFGVHNPNAFPVGFGWFSVLPVDAGRGAVAAGADTIVEVERTHRLPTVLTVIVDLRIQDVAVAC